MAADVAGLVRSWRHDRRTANCWQLARRVWLEETGEDIGDRTPADISAAALKARFDRDIPDFVEISRLRYPCLILMLNPCAIPHVGVAVQGSVAQDYGGNASFLPPDRALAGFRKIRYFTTHAQANALCREPVQTLDMAGGRSR